MSVRLRAVYSRLLSAALARRGLVLGAALLSTAAGVFLITRTGTEFMPTLDEGDLAVHSLRTPGTSLTQAVRMQNLVEEKFKKFPEVKEAVSKIGTADVATDPMPPSVADGYVFLKPRDEWPDPARPKDDLIGAMERALAEVPGQQYEFLQPVQMRFNELLAGVRSEVAVKVVGDDLDVLERAGGEVEKVLDSVPGAAGVAVEQVAGLPVLAVTPDREFLSRAGIGVDVVQGEVVTALAGREVGAVFEGDRRYPIVVRLSEDDRADPGRLLRLPVRLPGERHAAAANAAGALFAALPPDSVPLGGLVRAEVVRGPNQISREDGKRRIVVTANVRGRDVGSFVAEAKRRVGAAVRLPPGYHTEWGGQWERLESAAARLRVVVPASLVLVFLLLRAGLGSVASAAAVFSAVPAALVGGVIAILGRGIPLSVSAGVGFIALSGVAVLNGLVMASVVGRLGRDREDVDRAVLEGALLRVRPVLMTALVAALGFVPMAVATGPGAEVQRPLATVVIGGIITSTISTLFVLPVLLRGVSEREKAGGKRPA